MTTETPINSPTTTRLRNFLIAIVAIVLSAALILGLRSHTNSASLTQLDQTSIPLEIAMSNGKPSLVEFYADWCTVCQKMVPDIAELKQQYTAQVNFVMLNVDNSKWLPEMLKYRVDGIPHFIFLGKQGETLAQAIGAQPYPIMNSNLQALITDSLLPYAQTVGQVSEFSMPVTQAN